MPSYVMVVDQRRCVGCMACIVACKAENEVPPEHFRTRVVEKVEGKFPHLRAELKSELCQHCDNPPCVYNCPTRASYKDKKTGLVLLDKKRCVGCKACIAACPYDARYTHPDKGYVDKCTFCSHRVKEGKLPACATTCVGKSRIFGDIDDPKSPVRKVLAETPNEIWLKSAGTEPRVYYIKKYGKKI